MRSAVASAPSSPPIASGKTKLATTVEFEAAFETTRAPAAPVLGYLRDKMTLRLIVPEDVATIHDPVLSPRPQPPSSAPVLSPGDQPR